VSGTRAIFYVQPAQEELGLTPLLRHRGPEALQRAGQPQMLYGLLFGQTGMVRHDRDDKGPIAQWHDSDQSYRSGMSAAGGS